MSSVSTCCVLSLVFNCTNVPYMIMSFDICRGMSSFDNGNNVLFVHSVLPTSVVLKYNNFPNYHLGNFDTFYNSEEIFTDAIDFQVAGDFMFATRNVSWFSDFWRICLLLYIKNEQYHQILASWRERFVVFQWLLHMFPSKKFNSNGTSDSAVYQKLTNENRFKFSKSKTVCVRFNQLHSANVVN